MNASDHSFIVLAYEQSPFLGGCLETLRAQTLASPVSVATSTPCPHIAREAEAAGAPLLVNPERSGIGGDWNFALAAARTRYVTLAHQDDRYDPAFADRTMRLFRALPEGSLCFTGYREIGDDGRERPSKISRVKHLISAAMLGRAEAVSGLRLRLFLSFGNPLPCSSVTFDLERLGGFRFSEEYASNLDWEAWWRLQQQGRVFLHAYEPLVGRRHNGLTETSRLIKDGRRAQEDARMFARLWPHPIDRAIAALYAQSYR